MLFFSLDADAVEIISSQGIEGVALDVGAPGCKNRAIADGHEGSFVRYDVLDSIVDIFSLLDVRLSIPLFDQSRPLSLFL